MFTNDVIRTMARDMSKRRIREEQERTLEISALTGGEYLAWFQNLPALRGLWAAGSADNTGAMYDRSGQQRTLTYNGNPTLNIHNSLVPYWDYDGTGDYHSRADEAGLDVLGTETVIASAIHGLTVGAWAWVDTGGTDGIIGKWDSAGNQRSYVLLDSTTTFRFGVSSNGTLETVVDSQARSTGAWYFLVGRFTPSTEIAIFANGTKSVNTTSIPASVFGSTAAFEIARRTSAGTEIDGRVSIGFLCAAALSDTLITYLWERTRGAFGV